MVTLEFVLVTACLPKLAVTVATKKYPGREPPSDCPPPAHTSSTARWLFASLNAFKLSGSRRVQKHTETKQQVREHPQTILYNLRTLLCPCTPREEKLGSWGT